MSNDLNLDSIKPTTDKILSTENRLSDNDTSSSKNLDKEVQNDFMFAHLLKAEELEAQKQKYRHAEDEHDLRKEQLKFLSKITKYWLVLISVVSFLQGFKGIGFSYHINPIILSILPAYFTKSKFELSDPAYIALITTTTATILGLYTIAAIWLYKKESREKDEKKQEKLPTSE